MWGSRGGVYGTWQRDAYDVGLDDLADEVEVQPLEVEARAETLVVAAEPVFLQHGLHRLGLDEVVGGVHTRGDVVL